MTANEKRLDLAKRMRIAGGVPVFPRSLQYILEILHSEKASMAEISAAVEQDPVIAGRILKLANSAYYGLSQQVGSLHLAMVLLGMRNIRSVVLGIGFLEILSDMEEKGTYPGRDLRRHSVLTAHAAALLARRRGAALHGEEFVAGLIHDIGKLVLVRAYGDIAEDHAAELEGVRGQQGITVERRLFGIDHAEAGAWAAGEWKLPDAIVAAVADHHEAFGGELGTTAYLQAANELAHWIQSALPEAVTPEVWKEHPVLGASHLDTMDLRETLVQKLDTVL